MQTETSEAVTKAIGKIPYRAALAGGWIDQPFISKLNPEPPGSMVVVNLEPEFHLMERAGMATGTRNIALKHWNGEIPPGDIAQLVEELYAIENADKKDPSGSQDMIGLIYPGINRLDYDYHHKGGIFPRHIESCNNPDISRWLESVLHVVKIAPRPAGYNPLGVMNLDSSWIARLGRTGRNCYDAILAKDIKALGDSMNECMCCWMAILPQTVTHSLIRDNLLAILLEYQSKYPGAMFSGCGGGYLYVVSNDPVPGAFKVSVRTAGDKN